MNDGDDIFASAGGGSLLNDLLSDLNAAVEAANRASSKRSGGDDYGGDDLFALLERELTSTYADGGGAQQQQQQQQQQQMGTTSAAAFVVNQQANYSSSACLGVSTPPATSASGSDDAWSAALSQFGTMSLAADFLAADSAAKEHGQSAAPSTENEGAVGLSPTKLVGKLLFEEDEDYALEEEVTAGETGGLAALLGASASASASRAAAAADGKKAAHPVAEGKTAHAAVPPPAVPARDHPEATKPAPMPAAATAPPPPPPSGPMPPPPGVMQMMPPGYPMPPPGVMPPVMMMHPPPPHHHHPHPMPPGMMMHPPPHPMQFNPAMMMPPPPGQPGGMMGIPPSPHGPPMSAGGPRPPDDREFPALGARPGPPPGGEVAGEEKADDGPSNVFPPQLPRFLFNDASPGAPPVDARRVQTRHMPSRDVTYIVHLMLRPMQSLDVYNDDYYHWSVVNRKGIAAANASARGMINPDPVWKDTKAMAAEQDGKFQEAIRARAIKFAEEKKSLGQMVKTNVKRPKALLTTPVLNKESARLGEGEGGDSRDDDGANSRYELEQRKNRIGLWKARVAVDRGYSAFLTLVELRRLIQANSTAPGIVTGGELVADVRMNVVRLHASLGVSVVGSGSGGRKETEVDAARLGSALSLPKGRVLCARAVEEGILPHPSACRVLPVALEIVLSRRGSPAGSEAEGEDRLLRALTMLVRTPRPAVDRAILRDCLDVMIAGAKAGELDVSGGGRARMELLHSILSVGKAACCGSGPGGLSPLAEEWSGKEKMFMELLNNVQT